MFKTYLSEIFEVPAHSVEMCGDFVKKIHDEFEIELILDMLSILNEQERLVIDWVFIQNKPIK